MEPTTTVAAFAANVDVDWMASDLAEMLDKYGDDYGLPELDMDDIRAALPVFLAALEITYGHRVAAETDGPAASNGTVIHHTEHTCVSKAAGGKLDKNCPRCQELANGAPRRGKPEWVQHYENAKASGNTALAAEIKAHFGVGGRHPAGQCGPVCHAFPF